MSEASLRIASAAVRAWTQLYTCGLPKEARDARRDEIESDLWESMHDRDGQRAGLASHIWMRLVGGVFDDVRWRAEQITDAGANVWRVGITFAVVTLIVLWMIAEAILPAGYPQPPSPPRLALRPVLMRQPPPPPPPPCRPAGFEQDPGAPCTK